MNRTEYFVGIDPGFKGGFAIINSDLKLIACQIMPVIKTAKRNELAIPALNDLLMPNGIQPQHIFIEKSQSMPGMGSTGAFNYGKGYGIILGFMSARLIRYTEIHPTVWKKKIMGTNKDKGAAIIRAQQLFGVSFIPEGKKVPHDGLAEAALIAYYGVTTMKEE